jgi:malate/lactate dehydrogenase
MKKQIEKIGQVVVRSANVAGRGLSGVQHHAQDLGQVITHTVSKGALDVLAKAGSAAGSAVSTAASTALQAKDLAVQSVTDVITHEKPKRLLNK